MRSVLSKQLVRLIALNPANVSGNEVMGTANGGVAMRVWPRLNGTVCTESLQGSLVSRDMIRKARVSRDLPEDLTIVSETRGVKVRVRLSACSNKNTHTSIVSEYRLRVYIS